MPVPHLFPCVTQRSKVAFGTFESKCKTFRVLEEIDSSAEARHADLDWEPLHSLGAEAQARATAEHKV